jgi:imidazole glycerol phosphate synthase subunit HisF
MARTILRLDIKNDWIVKGRQFEGVQKVFRIDNDFQLPKVVGIEELFLLDTTRSFFGLPPNFLALERIARKTLLPITFGGGICSIDHVLEAFDRGASRVYLNSAVTRQPNLIKDLVQTVGAQAIVGGCEYRNRSGIRECYIDSGREPLSETLTQRAKSLLECGVGEVICCSIGQDGLQTGFDTCAASEMKLPIPVILSGGGNEHDFTFRNSLHSAADGYCFSSTLIKYYD